MYAVTKETVPDLLIRNIPRDLVMGVEDALLVGAGRGFKASLGMNDGHRPHALGQMRHFHMNETFFDALAAAGGCPSPIRGNNLVVGRTGIFSLGRFNVSGSVWNGAARSKTRKQLALANKAVEPLVQQGLFDTVQPISAATAFFVASFSGSIAVNPETPLNIDIAVPDSRLKNWLFREPLHQFLARYDVVPAQVDEAFPTLKAGVIKRDGRE